MSWIDRRTPPVPEVFRSHLSDSSAESGGVEELGRAAEAAIAEALARPGRDRNAAFHLLAADAYATYACEAAAGADDVLGELREILQRLQSPAS